MLLYCLFVTAAGVVVAATVVVVTGVAVVCTAAPAVASNVGFLCVTSVTGVVGTAVLLL